MYAIEITRNDEDYYIIRLSDKDGWFCSYCGFNGWPFFNLFNEYGIENLWR